MSPSASNPRTPGHRLIALGLTAAAIACNVPPAAQAHPEHPDRPTAPIVEVVAPVVDIRAGTQSLDQGISVETARGAARARLDSRVLFGRDSARLRPAARDRIKKVSAAFAPYRNGTIQIVGYTDDLGSAEHGLDLSRRRAQAVANVIRDRMPDTFKIVAFGRGEQHPAVPNTSEANRARNRRVVITLTTER